jgi:hypothetical protein
MSDDAFLMGPRILVPETVAIEGDYLVYTFPRNNNPTTVLADRPVSSFLTQAVPSRNRARETYTDGRPTAVRPTDSSVLRFARLADPAAICEYAKRYGVLRATADGRIGVDDAPLEQTERDLKGKERLDLWLGLARRVRAILNVNAAIQGRARSVRLGASEDWEELGVHFPPEDLRDAQFLLLDFVRWWMELGKVRITLGIARFSTKKTEWKVEVTYAWLAGGIAYRLLLMVAGESRLYSCDACKMPYIRMARAPRSGQENFCSDCHGVALTRAVARLRERQRRERLRKLKQDDPVRFAKVKKGEITLAKAEGQVKQERKRSS